MKKSFKGLFSLLLVIAIIASLFTVVPGAQGVESYAQNQPSRYSKEYNSGDRDVICTTLDGTSASSYYTGSYTYENLSSLSESALKTSLSTLMKSTHKNISSYDDCHYKANRTDCENENGSSKKLSLIYTSYTATMSQWNGWNREHVWPKSLGGDNTSGGGADLHHIRPSDAVVNSTRGNKKYGEANGGKAVNGSNPAVGVLGGHYGSYFEPLDNVKGDVARICLYVYVRWGSSWGADSITKVFQSVDVLLEWCEMDPVDTWEMGRNEVVEDIQGNRNVFIDYPEYAWLLFGEEVPSDMTTPSGMAKQGSGSGNTGGNQGGTDTPCTHVDGNGDNKCDKCGETVGSGNQGGDGNQGGSSDGTCHHTEYELINEVISCTEMGYSGDKKCLECGEVFEMGDYTFPTGEHTVGEIISEEGGKRFYVCGVCGEGVVEGGESDTAGGSSLGDFFNALFGGNVGEAFNILGRLFSGIFSSIKNWF